MTRNRTIALLTCLALTVAAAGFALAQMAPGGHRPQPHQPHQPMPPGQPGMGLGMGAPGQPNPMHKLHQAAQFAEIVKRLKEAAFDSETVAAVAVGGLKDEVKRKPEDVTKDLEALLEKTKTQGIRNVIRQTLKDIYKAQGKDEKVLAQLHALIAENDKALQKKGDD